MTFFCWLSRTYSPLGSAWIDWPQHKIPSLSQVTQWTSSLGIKMRCRKSKSTDLWTINTQTAPLHLFWGLNIRLANVDFSPCNDRCSWSATLSASIWAPAKELNYNKNNRTHCTTQLVFKLAVISTILLKSRGSHARQILTPRLTT